MSIYPLSESQLGIFYEWVQNPRLTGYNLPCLLKYSLHIDPNRLEYALHEVFRNRPICYTRIIQEGEEVRQYIDLERSIPIKKIYLNELELERLVANFVQPFDLYNDPLYRVFIIQTEESVYLLLDVHHIITDGMSMIQFFKDVDAVYCGQMLEEEKYTFCDSVLAEKETFASTAYQNAAAFYKNKFQGMTMARLSVKSTDSIGYTKQISRFVSAKDVDDFCVEHRVTPNLLFLSAYSLALSLFSREKQVIFYTVNHGRNDKHFRHCYGTFIKSAPVIMTVSSQQPVIEFIKSAKNEMVNMIRNGIYPFTHFCRDLLIKPETLFAFQHDIEEKIKLSDEEVILQPLPKGLTSQNLSVVIYHLDDQYEIRLEYNDSRYEEEVMQQFTQSIQTCSNSLIKSPERQLKDIDLVSIEERQDLLTLSKGESILWKDGDTFLDLFRKQVQKAPERIAVVDQIGHITYQELDERSDSLAAELIKIGIQMNDFVGIMLPRRKEFIIGVLGILKAGGAYLPLAVDYPYERLQYMLKDSEARILITNNDLFEKNNKEGKFFPLNILLIDNIQIRKPSKVSLPVIFPEQSVYMIYTSGSTGAPKGVVIQHKALASYIQVCSYIYQLDQNDRIFCHCSFSFDASVEDLFTVLTKGGELHILSDDLLKEPVAISEYIRKYRLTGGSFTTQFGVELLNHYDLPLKYVTVGGERLEVVPNITARFFNSYGPTEFTVGSTFFEPQKGVDYKSIPIGRPVPNSYAYVLNENFQLVPRGCIGELCLSGSQIAKEYWKQPELTKSKFVQNPFSINKETQRFYRTGDMVRWNSLGELEYIGRLDSQIKLRGFRIEIGEIELTITQYEGILQVIVDVKEINGKQHLCAYYTSDRSVSRDSLRDYLKNHLAYYMVPSVFVQLDKLPVTLNGKIDRQKLPHPFLEMEGYYVAPSTIEEKLLTNIVQNILHIGNISVETNLFDMGLTSIQAMSVVIEAEAVGIKLSVSSLYSSKTIRNILKDKQSLPYYWKSEYDENKPAFIFISGDLNYDSFFESLKDKYSFFVFRPYQEYYRGEKDENITVNRLLDYYISIIQVVFNDIPIYAITGFCLASELSILLADRLMKMRLSRPKVLIIDGFAKRSQVDPIPVVVNNDPIQDSDRVSSLLANDLSLLRYDGEILICLSGKTTKCLFIRDKEEDDEELLKSAYLEFNENKKLWKQMYPDSPYYEINADHWSLFDPEPVKEFVSIISENWK
ncbi:non-ribosomal peptide synthetase [uncultured Parabacteroides sp.]|uniref:non-ribosomal peptide synthetase n=1 Tax=uncultured Parabacteroides sp. TaxID=512312 RepID=UPI0025994AA8|nr:non-ribosomal peptide synthetase [uncultured Parabacteroides sp.]